MKRAKWSAAPVEPGAGTLAWCGPGPSGGGQPCHSQQMDIQVSHRPLFESYQICHRKPSHSSSRVTPARVIFASNKTIYTLNIINCATYKWMKNINTFWQDFTFLSLFKSLNFCIDWMCTKSLSQNRLSPPWLPGSLVSLFVWAVTRSDGGYLWQVFSRAWCQSVKPPTDHPQRDTHSKLFCI